MRGVYAVCVWPDLSPIQVSSCAVQYLLPCLENSWERANHPDSSASRAKLTGSHQETHLDVALHEPQPPA